MMSLAEGIIRLIDRFYLPPLAALMPRQTFRYAVCGCVTYLAFDPVCYFLIYNYVVAHRFFDLGVVVLSPHIAAMLLVFPFTFFCGFWLNRNVAFRNSPVRTHAQLLRYLLSIIGSVGLTYVGMKFFVELCGLWPHARQGGHHTGDNRLQLPRRQVFHLPQRRQGVAAVSRLRRSGQRWRISDFEV